MPALNTRKLSAEEALAFRDLLQRSAKHFGLRKVKDLAPYVQPFIPVRFDRYIGKSAMSRDKVLRIKQLLESWLDLPERCLPTPAQVHRTYQSVQLLLLTKKITNACWMQHVDAFVRPILMQAPGSIKSTWSDTTGDRPTCSWSIKNIAHLRVLIFFDRRDASACVAVMRAGDVMWRVAVAGSWCHETWLRVADYIWRSSTQKTQKTADELPDVLRQVGDEELRRMTQV